MLTLLVQLFSNTAIIKPLIAFLFPLLSYHNAEAQKNYVQKQKPDGTIWIVDANGADSMRIYPPDSSKVATYAAPVVTSLSDSIQTYNAGGRVLAKIKVWKDTVALTGSSPFTVNISTAGFSKITNIQATGYYNGAAVASIPLVVVKSYSNTSVVLNIMNSNISVIGALGSSATGLTQATNLTGVTVFLRVDGN